MPQPAIQQKMNLFESLIKNIDNMQLLVASKVENYNALLNKNKIPKSYIDFLEQYKPVYDALLQNHNQFYVTKEDYLKFIHKVIDTLSNYSNTLKSLA